MRKFSELLKTAKKRLNLLTFIHSYLLSLTPKDSTREDFGLVIQECCPEGVCGGSQSDDAATRVRLSDGITLWGFILGRQASRSGKL